MVNNAIIFLDTWNLARTYDSNHLVAATNHAEVAERWSKLEIGNIKFNCDASIFSSESWSMIIMVCC